MFIITMTNCSDLRESSETRQYSIEKSHLAEVLRVLARSRNRSARGRERRRPRRIKDQTRRDSIAIEFQRSSVTIIWFASTAHHANVNKLNQI